MEIGDLQIDEFCADTKPTANDCAIRATHFLTSELIGLAPFVFESPLAARKFMATSIGLPRILSIFRCFDRDCRLVEPGQRSGKPN